MLWLAGLMGLAGVGVASLVGLNATEVEEDDDIFAEDELIHENSSDLLQEINAQSDEADGLLKMNPEIVGPSSVSTNTADGWGDDILNEVMGEFDTADGADSGHSQTGEESIQPFLLQNPSSEVTGFDDYQSFSLNDWIAERSGAEILDYTAESESLMLVWDDLSSDANEPDVDVAPDPDDPEVMQVSMNGENVAEVYGDTEMNVSDLTLIPLSSAMIIGLAPAVANFRTPTRAA